MRYLFLFLLLSLLNGKVWAEDEMNLSVYGSLNTEGWVIEKKDDASAGRILGLLDFGVLVKDSILGDGEINLNFLANAGANPSTFAGDFNGLSNIAYDEGIRLFQAWYGNKMANWDWKIGLLAADDDFMLTEGGANFINSGFGANAVLSSNTVGPIWPVGGLGAYFSYQLDEHLTIRSGFYDGDVGDHFSNEHGLDISVNSNEGTLYLLELDIAEQEKLWNLDFKLGGFLHSGKNFQNYQTNTTEDNLWVWYLVAERNFQRANSVWARWAASPQSEKTVVRDSLDLGFWIQSPIANRSMDSWGVSYLRTGFNKHYRRMHPEHSATEQAVELTYLLQISDQFVVQPDIQYLMDPPGAQASAWAFGLRSAYEF